MKHVILLEELMMGDTDFPQKNGQFRHRVNVPYMQTSLLFLSF